jgi:hypothetical protein
MRQELLVIDTVKRAGQAGNGVLRAVFFIAEPLCQVAILDKRERPDFVIG